MQQQQQQQQKQEKKRRKKEEKTTSGKRMMMNENGRKVDVDAITSSSPHRGIYLIDAPLLLLLLSTDRPIVDWIFFSLPLNDVMQK